jgi:hypothetical protein
VEGGAHVTSFLRKKSFPPRFLRWLKKFNHHSIRGFVGWHPKKFNR